MNNTETSSIEKEEGILDAIGGILVILFVVLLVLGIIFASLKWKTVTLCTNDIGGFNTTSSTWWGLVKDEGSYKFNEGTKEWQMTIKGNTKIKL